MPIFDDFSLIHSALTADICGNRGTLFFVCRVGEAITYVGCYGKWNAVASWHSTILCCVRNFISFSRFSFQIYRVIRVFVHLKKVHTAHAHTHTHRNSNTKSKSKYQVGERTVASYGWVLPVVTIIVVDPYHLQHKSNRK